MNIKFLTIVSSAVALLNTNLSAQSCDQDCNKPTPCKTMVFKQGEPLSCECPSAYNTPAAIRVEKCRWWTPYVDASFTYWHANEEGLGIATSAVFSSGSSSVVLSDNSSVLLPDWEYTPGFKLGMGIDFHEWVFDTTYTWVRNHANASANAPSSAVAGTPVWFMDDWFLQTSSAQSLSGSSVSSKWRLGMDLLDATLGRPYYQGSTLTINPFAGLRAAWIRQSMSVKLNQLTSTVAQPLASHNKSHSWGIGPRVGLDCNFLFCNGFRFETDIAASLLFTSYDVSHKEYAFSSLITTPAFHARLNDFNTLSPNADLGLGLGWGQYLDCMRYHIDFSAMYDFSAFWGQNMMRRLIDESWAGTDASPGNLFIHGLTLTGRFDY